MIGWIKKNKLAAVLLVVVCYFLFGSFFSRLFSFGLSSPSRTHTSTDSYLGSPYPNTFLEKSFSIAELPYPETGYTPQAGVEDRLVIEESDMSLLVKDVVDAREKILEYTNKSGGYMVSSSTLNPQEIPTAKLVIRVPSEKLEEALQTFRSLSVKVVSENLIGRDVTDRYIDLGARIATYEKTQQKFEAILNQASEISDITNLTQQIIYTQERIDALKGQQDYLKKNSELAKLTVYLSTDEIALPYTPSETFRPNIIFKLAVRSLVLFTRTLATMTIWIAVYSIVWIPALVIYISVRKWKAKRKPTKTPPSDSL